MQKLDLLSSIKFLNEIPLYKTRDLLRCCRVETYMPGQTIIKENTYGSKFYIVMTGICRISSEDPSKKFSKFAYTGDYFGETALIDQGKRNADVTAHTNLSLLCLDKSDFKWVFGIVKDQDGNYISTDSATCTIVERLKNLTATRKNKYSEFINKNLAFSKLTESQKVQVNMFIKHQNFPAGTVLWSEKKPPTFCLFLYSGEVSFQTPDQYKHRLRHRLRPGCVIGDFPCLAGEAECSTSLTAETDMEALTIKKEDLLIFLGKNPGMMLLFKDEYLVE